jgi:hypothetical protein
MPRQHRDGEDRAGHDRVRQRAQRALQSRPGEERTEPGFRERCGRPRSSGKGGAPIQRKGRNAIITSSRYWSMCTCSSSPANASSGDAMATKIAARPARNAVSRPAAKRAGICACSALQPRA